jgi:hypothetical protein
MAKTSDTRIPKKVVDLLKADYLDEGEEIIEAIHEAYIPRIDFRWIVLTNTRVIIAIRKLFPVEFLSIPLDGISVKFVRSIFFDILEFKQINNQYRATMYSFDRSYTLDFFNQVRNQIRKFQDQKQLRQSEITLQPLQALENLIELKNKGEISDKEYLKLKNEILENMKKE